MNTGMPNTTLLTQANVRKAWGEEFERLSERGMIRIIHAGGVWIDGRTFLPSMFVRGATIKMVTYGGTGKYHSMSRLITFASLPDDDDTYFRWTTEDGWQPPPAPQGEDGWWPVLSIQTTTGYLEAREKKGELCVCFYQLQGGRIIGWWISPEDTVDAMGW